METLYITRGNNFCFYFHHTGSIGLYYENETPSILALRKNDKYEVLSCSDVS